MLPNLKLKSKNYYILWPISVSVRSKAQVFGHSPAEIAGSNLTGSMEVILLCVLYVVR
jgi:hypothetical protein